MTLKYSGWITQMLRYGLLPWPPQPPIMAIASVVRSPKTVFFVSNFGTWNYCIQMADNHFHWSSPLHTKMFHFVSFVCRRRSLAKRNKFMSIGHIDSNKSNQYYSNRKRIRTSFILCWSTMCSHSAWRIIQAVFFLFFSEQSKRDCDWKHWWGCDAVNM